ncbi:MAG: M24 family metallopeptidase [Candidatus Nanosalina sp.]
MGKFRERMEKCREKMREGDADYVFLTPDANMYHVSGYSGEIHERHFFLVITSEDQFFFIPDLYEEQVRGETWIEDFRTWSDSENPRERLEEELAAGEEETVLLSEEMQARFTLDLMEIFPESDYGLAAEVFEDLRLRKDEEEIKRIRESSRIVDEVVEELREEGEEIVGKTEDEVAEIIEEKMDEKGGEKPSFNIVASSGPNGSKPHYEHGDREIQGGDPVVLDFGCYRNHYPSDQTRTLVFGGEPSEKFQSVFEVVKNAQRKALEKVKPGVKAKEVDRTARKVIEEAGYGENFIHRTGHGVGLEVHEPPYINQESSRKLEEGMVFSVEPGIYLEGEFGVRIEDLVLVTEDGCRRLNRSSRSWKC